MRLDAGVEFFRCLPETVKHRLLKARNEPTQFDKIKLRAVEQFCAARGRTAGTGCQQRRDRTQEHREKKNGQNLAPCSKFHKYAPFTLSTIIGRRNNVDLFCRFIIARHNKKTKEFSEILSVSHALPHRGQYPQSEYGRHLQFVQAAGKNVQTDCVCSGAP